VTLEVTGKLELVLWSFLFSHFKMLNNNNQKSVSINYITTRGTR
jgi:hypothetical protein